MQSHVLCCVSDLCAHHPPWAQFINQVFSALEETSWLYKNHRCGELSLPPFRWPPAFLSRPWFTRFSWPCTCCRLITMWGWSCPRQTEALPLNFSYIITVSNIFSTLAVLMPSDVCCSVVVFTSISPSMWLLVQVFQQPWLFLSAQMRYCTHEAAVVPGVVFRCICSTVSTHHKDAGQLKTQNLCYSAKPNDCWLLCRSLQCEGLNFLWKVYAWLPDGRQICLMHRGGGCDCCCNKITLIALNNTKYYHASIKKTLTDYIVLAFNIWSTFWNCLMVEKITFNN